MIYEDIEVSGSIDISGSFASPSLAGTGSYGSPRRGSMFHDKSDDNIKIYNGTSWEVLGEQVTPDTSMQYLVVAGGGGGGFNYGGGGGAGGAITGSVSLTSLTDSASYTATVGAGGGSETQGSNSSFSGTGISTITATGGGKGGTRTGGSGVNGGNGGSGGGGCYSGGTGGSGTNGQGFAGAAGPVWPQYGGGGGGGATQQPARPQGNSAVTDPPEGSGGRGLNWPAGSNDGYAGGGGAAHQGNPTTWSYDWGGGGNGSDTTMANGVAGTGGGGAGATGTSGNSGGSGVIKLRYQSSTYLGYGGEMTTSGSYKTHSFYYSSYFVKTPANLPTTNLVVRYDAGNSNSYSGTGTLVTDLQGNVNGTLTGVGYDSADGGAFTFGADGDYIDLGSNTLDTYLEGAVNFSVGFWVNLTTHGYLLDQGNLGTDSTGTLEFRSNVWVRNNSSANWRVDPDWSGNAIDPINRGWHFISGTKNGLTGKLYLDGMPVGTSTNSSHFTGSGKWKIGRRAYSTSSAFGGKIAQVFIYNATLTDDQMAQLYAATNRY